MVNMYTVTYQNPRFGRTVILNYFDLWKTLRWNCPHWDSVGSCVRTTWSLFKNDDLWHKVKNWILCHFILCTDFYKHFMSIRFFSRPLEWFFIVWVQKGSIKKRSNCSFVKKENIESESWDKHRFWLLLNHLIIIIIIIKW